MDQILTELSPQFDPQIAGARKDIAAIPGQLAAEESGLQAKQTNAFDDIVGGARRRGLGFSGIPLAEQARYTASEYMPALARLRQSGQDRTRSLEDAIFGIQERRGTLAQQLRQQDLSLDEQKRQFDANMAFQREQAARARAAAAGFSPSMGGISPSSGGGRGTVIGGDPIKARNEQIIQEAFNNVAGRQGQSQAAIRSDYAATLDSANRGNPFDKAKIDVYRRMFPWVTQAAGPGLLTPEFGNQVKGKTSDFFSGLGGRLQSNLGIFR